MSDEDETQFGFNPELPDVDTMTMEEALRFLEYFANGSLDGYLTEARLELCDMPAAMLVAIAKKSEKKPEPGIFDEEKLSDFVILYGTNFSEVPKDKAVLLACYIANHIGLEQIFLTLEPSEKETIMHEEARLFITGLCKEMEDLIREVTKH